MPDSSFIIAVAAFAFVLAGFVKGVLGQGLPTVAIGVLSLVMSPGEGAALVVVPALLTNIWQAWYGPSLMPLIRRLWPTLAASFIGTFVATALGLERDDLVQAQGISFTVSTLALTFVLLGSGTLNASNAAGSFVAMMVTFVGMFLGQYVRKFVHPELFRFLFFTGMLVLGVHLAFIHR